MSGSVSAVRVEGTVNIAATTASAAVTLPPTGESVIVFNNSPAVAFVAFGHGDAVADPATGTPVPPGAQMLLAINTLVTTGAAVLSEGTGTVYFSRAVGTQR